MRYRSYQSPNFSRLPIGPGSMALLGVVGLFVMLPFTQYLAGLNRKDATVRTVDIAPPPPQFTPPEPPPPQEEPPQEEPPEMDQPPPQLSLSQLNMAINVGFGVALAGDFSLGGMSVSASETQEAMMEFEISDLDKKPNMIRRPPIVFTPEMRRERKEGKVTMVGVINPDGSVSIREVIETIDASYTTFFRKYFESIKYEVPTVNGQPVTARVTFPIPVEWD